MKEGRKFYKNLMNGKISRGMLGLKQRFNSNKILQCDNVDSYFRKVVKKYIKKSDVVLDLGCGTGSFTVILSKMSKKVVSIDIVKEFVESTKKTVKNNFVENAEVLYQRGDTIPCDDSLFDAVVLVDVLHHVEKIDSFLHEVRRVLKPRGRLLIFEPNKINPVMYMMHYLDENERGLLALGTPNVYRKILSGGFTVDNVHFSGLVIGPESRLFSLISDFLNHRFVYFWAGWLLPKIFVSARLKKCHGLCS